MKVRSGIDIVDISRIEKSIGKSDAFVKKCFTTNEISYCEALAPARKIESYAGRFAAKEAVSKALGTGIMAEGIALADIEIVTNEKGAPELVLHGKACELAEEMGIFSRSVSISHDGGYAVACCYMLSEN
ncbi:MAG: holo-ACP synthase [Saccharofermentans sp.]|nr:holo-ACP synthase [Saccharofermentans sp.]